MNNKGMSGITWIVIVLVLLSALGGSVYFFLHGPITQTTYQGKEVTLLVPHQAGIKCEPIDKVALNYNLPESGLWISKQDIGFRSKVVSNIIFKMDYGFWTSLGKDIRVAYKICDANKVNCGTMQYQSTFLQLPGTVELSLQDIDTSQNSIYVAVEKRTIGTLLQWKPTTGGMLSYSAEKYGLNMYSTTAGFRTICYSGCDLSCPNIGVRDTMVENAASTLNFYESTNYIEYWAAPQQVGDQFGGTIWDSTKQEFCFGGFIYSPSTITTETGKAYLYPGNYVRHQDCCNGATIAITNGQKVCTNGVWQTINNENPPQCSSALECPNQGIDQGTLVNGQPYKYRYTCVSGKCQQSQPTSVKCIPPNIGCAQDQVCQDFTCQGGNVVQPPTNITPVPDPNNDRAACEAQAKKNPFLGYVFVETQTESCGWNPLCHIGITQPKVSTTTKCTATYVPYYIAGGIIIILVVIIVLLFRKPRRNRRR